MLARSRSGGDGAQHSQSSPSTGSLSQRTKPSRRTIPAATPSSAVGNRCMCRSAAPERTPGFSEPAAHDDATAAASTPSSGVATCLWQPGPSDEQDVDSLLVLHHQIRDHARGPEGKVADPGVRVAFRVHRTADVHGVTSSAANASAKASSASIGNTRDRILDGWIDIDRIAHRPSTPAVIPAGRARPSTAPTAAPPGPGLRFAAAAAPTPTSAGRPRGRAPRSPKPPAATPAAPLAPRVRSIRSVARAINTRHCWSNAARSSTVSASRTRAGEASANGNRPGSTGSTSAAAVTRPTVVTTPPTASDDTDT